MSPSNSGPVGRSLLNATAGRYKETGRTWLDVAPGRGPRHQWSGIRRWTASDCRTWPQAGGALDRGGQGVDGVRSSPDGARPVTAVDGLDPDGSSGKASYRLSCGPVPDRGPVPTVFPVAGTASGRAVLTGCPRRNERGSSAGGGPQGLRGTPMAIRRGGLGPARRSGSSTVRAAGRRPYRDRRRALAVRGLPPLPTGGLARASSG